VSRSLYTTIISRLQISRVALRVRIGPSRRHASWRGIEASKWLHRVHRSAEIVLIVSGVGAWVGKGHGAGVVGLCCSCFPCFGCAGSFLACRVFLCETLLAGLALPVIVTHTSSAGDESAAKLSEHGPRGNDGNLS
jgi:hypothetical protein